MMISAYAGAHIRSASAIVALLLIGLLLHFLCPVFFFFSSRRRHTRSLCDWSSDVCSSDLEQSLVGRQSATPVAVPVLPVARDHVQTADDRDRASPALDQGQNGGRLGPAARLEIGRASCRERE